MHFFKIYKCLMLLRPSHIVAYRFLSTSAVKYVRRDQKKIAKPNVPSEKKIAFPPAFENRLISWPQLIGCEIEENLKVNDEYIDEYVSNLKFGEFNVSALEGTTIELIPKDSKIVLTTKLSRAMPIRLIEKPDNGKVRHYEGIVLDYSDNNFRLMLRNLSSKTFDPQAAAKCSYSITPSEEFSTFHALQDFLKKRHEWKKMPGFPILQSVYRALPLKSVYNDRRLKCHLDLNESQRDAVNAAMNKHRLIVAIQGPPGTGKTEVLTEIILQANHAKQNILICAVTHQAIANLMKRVGDHLSNFHRLSEHVDSPNTLKAAIQAHSNFDLLVQRYETLSKLKQQICDVEQLQKLGASAENLKYRIKGSILRGSNIVFSTLGSSSLRTLRNFGFKPDLVIIEEAGQCIECATWLALLQAPRAILAGDDYQLGPVIRSQTAVNEGFGESLLGVIRKEHGSKATMLLKEQYRMNSKIQKWSSDTFYESKLQPHESVKDVKLSDLSPTLISDDYSPLIFIDTVEVEKNQKDNWEKRVIHSFTNRFEADIVALHLHRLLNDGLAAENIGIITPYSSQVDLIKQLLGKDIDSKLVISSVDGFQGEQREAIIMSLVRNNTRGNIGFLTDLKRMNVSVTRAKRHLCVIGNSKMLKDHAPLSSLLDVFQNDGRIINAMDYLKRNKFDVPKNQRIQKVK
uniref:DNA helicase n=1 Tax=Panagrolaimus superbus TaxID=310955 RepID=A0A914YBM4_9BILA